MNKTYNRELKAVNIRDVFNNPQHRKAMGYFKDTAYKFDLKQVELLQILTGMSIKEVRQHYLEHFMDFLVEEYDYIATNGFTLLDPNKQLIGNLRDINWNTPAIDGAWLDHGKEFLETFKIMGVK